MVLLVAALLVVISSTLGDVSGSVITRATCQCGKAKIQRIVGGTEAVKNQHPWQVRLVITEGTQSSMCGGTLISPNYVLTAAHCFTENVTEVSIYLGDHDSTQEDTFEKVFTVVGKTNIVLHENYKPQVQENDIALIKLPSPAEYSNGIQPACLPWTSRTKDFAGEPVIATGWGETSYGGSSSDVLLQVQLKVISNKDCLQWFPSLIDNMMCAGETQKDTCRGDSGGPLAYVAPDPAAAGETLTYCIGIVSFGPASCGEQPGVYTRVTGYLDWIKAKTSETFCEI